MIRSIVTHPNKMLRKRSREVVRMEGFRSLVEDCVDTMVSLNASGFSAIQLGIPMRVVFINGAGGRVVTLYNPSIIHGEGSVLCKERCPSLPGRIVEVDRHEYIRVEHVKSHGVEIFETYELALAVALQHEIDHLNGVLIIDRDASHRPAVLQ